MACSRAKPCWKRSDYRSVLRDSGEEALELLATRKFDLVVTDYRMPKMDGVELIQGDPKIRLHRRRIILLSGFVEPLGLDEKTTGADVVISKSAGEVGNLVRCGQSSICARRSAKAAGAKSPPAKVKQATR